MDVRIEGLAQDFVTSGANDHPLICFSGSGFGQIDRAN